MVTAPIPTPPNRAKVWPQMSGVEDKDRNPWKTPPNPSTIRSAKPTKAASENSVLAIP
jgi:hypothetical protein